MIGRLSFALLALSASFLLAGCPVEKKKERPKPIEMQDKRSEPAPVDPKPAEPPPKLAPAAPKSPPVPPGPAERPLKQPPVPLQIRTPPPTAPIARTPARCPRWRYKLVPLRRLGRMDEQAVEKLLNRLGDAGWALARPAILLDRALLLSKCAPRGEAVKPAKANARIPRGPCRVRLKSTPPGASVMIAGESKRLGTTPLSLRLGRGERKTVRVTKVGWRQMVITLDCAQRRRRLLLTPAR